MELNFDNERTLLTTKREELQAALVAIQTALVALNGHAAPKAAPEKATAIRMGRRPMSAKAKQAARQRMLTYWANKRAETKPKARTKAAR